MQYERVLAAKVLVNINFEDLKHKYPEETKDINIGFFEITSEFSNLSTPEKWLEICKPVNDLFEYVTDSHKIEFLKLLQNIIIQINEVFENNDSSNIDRFIIVPLTKSIGTMINETFTNIGLTDYLYNFVTKKLYIGDFSQAGSNPQDKEEITYRYEDAVEVTMIAMVSKILFPVFGLFISNFKQIKSKSISQNDKELYCSYILEDFLAKHLSKAYKKLILYVTTHTTKKYDDIKLLASVEKDDLFNDTSGAKNYTTNAFESITTESLISQIVANLLTKAFVNGVIQANEFETRTILSYMDRSVYRIIKKKTQSADKPTIYYRRTDPSRDSDEKTPQFEIDSVSSMRTLDILGIINIEVDKLIVDFINTDEEKELFSKVLAHYKFHKIEPTRLNQLCLCSYFGDLLAGGESILYLSNDQYCKLISIYQLYLLYNQNYKLLHCVCMKYKGKRSDINLENKPTTDQSDLSFLRFGWNSLPSLKAYKNRNPLSAVMFERSIKAIIEELLENEYVLNTPDILWSILNMDNVNGSILIPDLHLIDEMISSFF